VRAWGRGKRGKFEPRFGEFSEILGGAIFLVVKQGIKAREYWGSQKRGLFVGEGAFKFKGGFLGCYTPGRWRGTFSLREKRCFSEGERGPP